MGGSSSKVDTEVSDGETAFFAKRDTPVQFSSDLISHLSNSSSPDSSSPSPARQQTLDSHIQQRLQRELTRLKSEEASIKSEIEKALEEENRKKDGEPGGARHSASLLEDLKALEERSGKLRKEAREGESWTILASDKKKLQECFLKNKSTPLNCRDEAEKFMSAVAGVEKTFVASIEA